MCLSQTRACRLTLNILECFTSSFIVRNICTPYSNYSIKEVRSPFSFYITFSKYIKLIINCWSSEDKILPIVYALHGILIGFLLPCFYSFTFLLQKRHFDQTNYSKASNRRIFLKQD